MQAKRSEAQLQSPATVKVVVAARRRDKGLPPVLPRTPDDQWAKMVENWPEGQGRQRSSGSEETELKVIDPWPVQPERKVIVGTFGKQPVEEGDSVVSEQGTIVKSQDVCTEASGSTLHCITTGPGFEIGAPMTPPKGTDYFVATAATKTEQRQRQGVPGTHAGSLGGNHLSTLQHLPQGPGISIEEMRAKELLSDPSSYPKELDRVYQKLNKFCNLRRKRRGLTEPDDWELEFRKEVTRKVTQVNTARAKRKPKKDGK